MVNKEGMPKRVPKSSMIHIRVTDEMYDTLVRRSVAHDESMGRIVRRALKGELARNQSE